MAFLVGQLCLEIDRPFHVAFIDLECVDGDHLALAPSECFDARWRGLGLAPYVNIYASVGGVVLSTTQQTYAYDPRLPWNNAPAFDAAGGRPVDATSAKSERLFLPFRRGVSIRLAAVGADSRGRQTRIFENPLSTYASTVDESIRIARMAVTATVAVGAVAGQTTSEDDVDTLKRALADFLGVRRDQVSALRAPPATRARVRRLRSETATTRFRVRASTELTVQVVDRLSILEKDTETSSALLGVPVASLTVQTVAMQVDASDDVGVGTPPAPPSSLRPEESCTVDFLRARDVRGNVALGADGHLLAEFSQMERFVVATLLARSLDEYWCAASVMPELTCLDMASASTFDVTGTGALRSNATTAEELSALVLSLSIVAAEHAVRRYGDARATGDCGTHGDGTVDTFDMTLLLMHQFQVPPYDERVAWRDQTTTTVNYIDRCNDAWREAPENDPESYAVSYESAYNRCSFLQSGTPAIDEPPVGRRLVALETPVVPTASVRFELDVSIRLLRQTDRGTWYRVRWRGAQLAVQLALDGVWTFQRIALSNALMDTRDSPTGYEVRFARWPDDVDAAARDGVRCANVHGAIGPGSALLGDTLSVYQQQSETHPVFCRFDLYLHVPRVESATLERLARVRGLAHRATHVVESAAAPRDSPCAVHVRAGSRGANGGPGAFQSARSPCVVWSDADPSTPSSPPSQPSLSPAKPPNVGDAGAHVAAVVAVAAVVGVLGLLAAWCVLRARRGVHDTHDRTHSKRLSTDDGERVDRPSQLQARRAYPRLLLSLPT